MIKIFYSIFVFVLIPMSVFSQSQAEKNNTQPLDTLVYTVYGMDCPGCEGGLEKQVNKIPSIEYSKANWKNQELLIVVKSDSVLDEKELERRVKKANFTLKKEEE